MIVVLFLRHCRIKATTEDRLVISNALVASSRITYNRSRKR